VHSARPRHGGALLVAAGAFATALATAGTVAASGPASAREPGSLTLQQPAPRAQGGLTAEQRRRADQIISAFENSTTQIQYGYAENLHDGRGVTSGRAGFCTGTGDAVIVVEKYTQRKPGNSLAGFLPELRRLAAAGSDDTSRLPEPDYITAWGEEARDRTFRDVQDEVVDDLYFNPAMRHADRAGLRTALARAQIYDAAIQHGDGEDPDSVGALVRRTNARAGGSPAAGIDERAWLSAFFEVRVADLRNPANEETRDEWAASVDRVYSMQRIARTGNYDLDGPIRFSVYGDEFVID